jgi:hypothetical protein
MILVYFVMPDLIRHPEKHWIPAFAGMTPLYQLYCNGIKILTGIKKRLGYNPFYKKLKFNC